VTGLPAQPLTRDAFAPYGRVVSLPERPRDAEGPGWRWWAEEAFLTGDGRPWGVGYLDLQPTEWRFDWAERHMRTQEAVFATSADLLVYAAPAEHPEDPGRLPAFEQFRVFRVPAGSGVVMDRGVWHGAPLAAEHPTRAIVFILEGTGRHDVTVVRFPDTPVAINEGPPATTRPGEE
jgi:ureidoglycolate lyase